MWTSVPQIPVRSTSISTSLRPTSGTGTSSSHSPCSRFFLTRAFIVFLIMVGQFSADCSRLNCIAGGGGYRPGTCAAPQGQKNSAHGVSRTVTTEGHLPFCQPGQGRRRCGPRVGTVHDG